MVEQEAVNFKVAGSNPARGAKVDYLRDLVLYQRVLVRHSVLIYHLV
ncbi:MAG: hypothetical protein UU17_C0037G0011, partial [Candidatus Nomurabacteria bacterium GW2011_GWA1_40_8]